MTSMDKLYTKAMRRPCLNPPPWGRNNAEVVILQFR
jgi:hypothetical protein